ncbi:hypothetical protein [Streptomyces cinnamoneus]|uniref:Uncharacterized protein n=1 Tax=Streptomyces cinnamoneus TaxID=53446 RepID=A0A918WHX7_STRCJ|nr:hypothetical protein [Streptomyces cinnamoneus]GHC45426.1 hypothetical protein GCM10010507_20870 [Streptomyces cinnamoneus]
MKKFAALSVTTIAATALFATMAAPAHAGPSWNTRVKCQQTDPDGRKIPTRFGNSELGWNHFSGPHNIKTCRAVNAALSGKVDKKNGDRLEYWGDAINGGRHVRIIVIAQYSRKTADGRYDAGDGQKIGVITAYCKGMNKCPNWLNE